MSTIVVQAFITLDGVVQSDGGPDEDRDGGFVMKGWLYVTGPSTKKVAGLRTWIARGETALCAPTRKPGGGTR